MTDARLKAALGAHEGQHHAPESIQPRLALGVVRGARVHPSSMKKRLRSLEREADEACYERAPCRVSEPRDLVKPLYVVGMQAHAYGLRDRGWHERPSVCCHLSRARMAFGRSAPGGVEFYSQTRRIHPSVTGTKVRVCREDKTSRARPKSAGR